ncbi:MAG TPA: hypothetical protein VF615_15830 [Longimicrobiaceae bacterium]|jgi:hypothetical protein
MPAASVTVVLALSVPPPEATTHPTAAPAIGRPPAETALTASESRSWPAGAPVWPSPPIFSTRAGCAGAAVAVKVAGASPAADAVTVYVPAAGPSVHRVRASPRESVGVAVADSVPASGATVQVTVTPATSLPFGSVTRATSSAGRGISALPAWPLPDEASMRAGTAAAVPVGESPEQERRAARNAAGSGNRRDKGFIRVRRGWKRARERPGGVRTGSRRAPRGIPGWSAPRVTGSP